MKRYLVLYKKGASLAAARAAVEAAGGTIVRENTAIGVATVESGNRSFAADVRAQDALKGAAQDVSIGHAPRKKIPDKFAIERGGAVRPSSGRTRAAVDAEPLAHLQWGNDMIDATATGSYAVQPGTHDVLVGIIDTGIDASHPDLAPNFNAALSRNFTTDIPLIDGECADDPDGSCTDPADVDEGDHGTHVAGSSGRP